MKAVIVLEALRNGCNSYSSIANYAIERHSVSISEKTIRRHIKVLRNLGYIINENRFGLVFAGEGKMNKNAQFGTSAYPILILKIIAKFKYNHPKQKGIIDLINVYYGCKINRKAVGRNLKALKAMGYPIERDAHGGYLLVSDDIKIN